MAISQQKYSINFIKVQKSKTRSAIAAPFFNSEKQFPKMEDCLFQPRPDADACH
jgi:hypothetical protein